MEGVIAKKKISIISTYIVMIAVGTLFLIFGVAALAFGEYIGFVLFLSGVFFLSVGIVWTVILVRLPKSYITLKDGKLYLYNGPEIFPSEMDYFTGNTTGLEGALFNWGKLVVSVAQQEYKFKFVANVRQVADTLNRLRAERIAVESVQKQILMKAELKENGQTKD